MNENQMNVTTNLYAFERAVDLSHDLENGMTIYPGDPIPSFKRAKTIPDNGVTISELNVGSHTGTHVEGPLHFLEGGKSIDQFSVKDFIGEAVVGDFSFKAVGDGITEEDLVHVFNKLEIHEGDIVVCYTGCSEHWGDDSVTQNFTYLTPEGAKYLTSKKVRGVGIDFLSIEKIHSETHATHKELLGHGLFIIESLSSELRHFLGQRILLMAAPIKFKDGDAAPCRAIGVPISR